MKFRFAFVLVAAMLASVFGAAVAQQGQSTPDTSGANMNATPSMGMENTSMGAFYFTVKNNGTEADRLVQVESDIAEVIEIHDVVMKDGVMSMVPQHDGVEIPADGELVLEPGSYHIMLIGLNQSLLDGEEFTATLYFENAGEVEVTVPIFMAEPGENEKSEPVKVGDDIEVSGIWARQAPRLHSTDTPCATPIGINAGHQPGQMRGMSATPGMGMENTSMGAFYFTVKNNGTEADRLVKVESDIAEAIKIHDVVMKDGVMSMVQQEDGVEISADGELVLEPGSYHIMLIGLNQSLLDGEEFTATLYFENAGEVEVTVPIFMNQPDTTALSDSVMVGEGDDIEVSGIWARQAPKLDGMVPPCLTPDMATPEQN